MSAMKTTSGRALLHELFRNLTVSSSNTYLESVRDRLFTRVDPDMEDLRICLPNGDRGLYGLEWVRFDTTDPPDNDGGHLLALEEDSEDKGLNSNEFRLPTTTAMVLQAVNSTAIIMPLATLTLDGTFTR